MILFQLWAQPAETLRNVARTKALAISLILIAGGYEG